MDKSQLRIDLFFRVTWPTAPQQHCSCHPDYWGKNKVNVGQVSVDSRQSTARNVIRKGRN